jgi:hypothetical protein
MREVHQWASGILHIESCFVDFLAHPVRSAMGCDYQCVCPGVLMLFGKFNTLLQKAIFDGWIVSQGAKDCDRPGFRRFFG